MTVSLASTPQIVARLHTEATCSKQSPESLQDRMPWKRRVGTPSLTKLVCRSSVCPQQHALGRLQCRAATYKVEIEHEGQKHMLEVPEGETILSVAIEAGLEVPYDCQLGVCMTCPAKLVKGIVDQDQGMLSDDVKEKGYALMCVAQPLSDCSIRSIPEEELLSLQLATADD